MAKILTEQPRIWSPPSLDPVQFGDGAPLHSAIAFDLVRILNNMQTYSEPTFSFLHDISANPSDPTAVPRCRYRVGSPGGGDGSAMLAQAPILVPVDAVRLMFSISFYRDALSGIDQPPAEINVNSLTLYLASAPCIHLHDPGNPAPAEAERLFLPSFISGPYSSHTVSAVAAGGTANLPGASYSNVFDDTFTNYAPRGLNNINDRNAFLIIVANFTGGVTGEQIRLAETSIWFQYE